MRQIKFRAWHGELKEYCEGTTSNMFSWIDDGQPITLEQFTGLQDNNGVDIYEGDIVKFQSRFDSSIGCIEYSNDSTRFVFNIGSEESPDYRDVGHGWYGTAIIGNKHQNPELIK